MKRLIALCLVLFPLAAVADDGAKAIPLRQAPANVQVINGKRFYSLSNVRRFTGSLDSPKALSIIHAPRPEGIPRRSAPLPAVPAPSASGGAQPAPSQASKDQILSIFAPEDKAAPTK